MSIKLTGEWKVSVKSKSASFDQRVVIVGTANGKDGTFNHSAFGTKTLKGSFGMQIQYKKGGNWHDSLMHIDNVSRTTAKLKFDIKSDDNVGYGDLDFNDLILEANQAVGDDDWCIWGQVKQYSGCIFNPCLLPRLVVDDWVNMASRLPKKIRDMVDPVFPELPPIDLPYPPPPPPWDYKAIQVEIPRELLSETPIEGETKLRRGAFRVPGLKTLSNPANEAYKTAGSGVKVINKPGASVLTKLKCRVNPAPGVQIRVIDYDPGPGESTGQLFPGTGDMDVLGQLITDDLGYYIFCFKWPYPGATGLTRPDILLQLIQINEEGIPAVTLQSRISWNIPNLYRKNFCVPSHLINTPPPEDIANDSRIFQYVGNLPVDRINQAALSLERGHATSQPGDLVNVDRAPFGGTLYLKGSFHNYSQVKHYRILYKTTDNPDGNIGYTTLTTPLKYYNADFDLITVGPGPVVFPGVPGDAYPIMRDNYAYSHPFGRQYKAYISTNSLKTGPMKTGFIHFKIQGLNSTGADVPGAVDNFVIRVDNIPPVPEIEPITPSSGAGAGCGYIVLQNPNDTFELTYRVNDAEGHLYKYYFNLFKCHNNKIGNNQYSPIYNASYPLHWNGTIDDTSGITSAPTWDGWVTVDMPNSGVLFSPQDINQAIADGAKSVFVAVSIELWAVSRSTDGRHSHLQWPRYVEVIGVTYNLPETP